MSTDFLQAIRLAELVQIRGVLKKVAPAGAKILEIGAGTGWQARELAASGYQVSAIDIPTSNHGKARIWPIIDFDGRFIPFPDKCFDVVYSSNVLEHVEDIETLNSEIARVLRSEGTAIHYVPTSTWRMWSMVVFYPSLFRDVFRRVRSVLGTASAQVAAPAGLSAAAASASQRSLLAKIIRRIVPHAHGAVGTCFSELWRFSRQSWSEFFSTSGWTITSYARNGLFLTGDMIFGPWLSVELRQRLSHTFGCTAHLYVLKRRLGRST